MDRCLALLRVGLLRILNQTGDHDLTSSIRCISGRIIQIQTIVRKLRLLYYKSKLSVDKLSHRRHFIIHQDLQNHEFHYRGIR